MGFIGGIVNISIGTVLLATVFIGSVKAVVVNGTCLTGYNGTACLGTSFTASEYTLWGVLAIAGIVGLIVGILNVFGIA